ncbi:MAG: hypothetical protein ACRDFC_02730 [Ignavibacteria bacterium]
MKKLIISLILIFSFHSGFSQHIADETKLKKRISLSLGMGISLINTPEFSEYLKNEIPYSDKDSIKAFSIGLEFFGGLEYPVSKSFSIKLDYSYFIKSITYRYSFFTYDFFYFIHQPYMMGFYVTGGKHYRFKIGAGAGYQFAQLERTLDPNTEMVYKSNGPGVRGEIIYDAILSKRLSSYISGFVFGNFPGKLKDSGGNVLISPNTGKEVNLSGFGIGLRLGLTYNF